MHEGRNIHIYFRRQWAGSTKGLMITILFVLADLSTNLHNWNCPFYTSYFRTEYNMDVRSVRFKIVLEWHIGSLCFTGASLGWNRITIHRCTDFEILRILNDGHDHDRNNSSGHYNSCSPLIRFSPFLFSSFVRTVVSSPRQHTLMPLQIKKTCYRSSSFP